MEFKHYDDFQSYSTNELQSLIDQKIRGSFLWMSLGLLITLAIVVFSFFNQDVLIFSLKHFTIISIIELFLVFVFSAMTYRLKANILKVVFIIYSIATGLTLSPLLYIYEANSIFFVFVGALALFIGLAIFGYTTNANITSLRSYLMAGLIALIIVSIVNIFLKNSILEFGLSILGIIIFIAFTAYDVQRIKKDIIYLALNGETAVLETISISGALSLYLDFINIFLYLLRFFGKKRD